MSTQYIIRLDDIHPRMNHERFERFMSLIENYNIKPILSVIPDNKDSRLMVDKEDTDFFNKIKQLQDKGYTIALHGYQHLLHAKNNCIHKINNYSEFAGLTYEEQKIKIRKGLDIFKKHNLVTDLFVAPAHSFDKNTIRALLDNGIHKLSDGFFLYPYYKLGIYFIPQQFWRFVDINIEGVFTFLFHLDKFSDHEFDVFIDEAREFLKRNAQKIIDFRFLEYEKYNSVHKKFRNMIFHTIFTTQYHLRKKIKKVIRKVIRKT